MTNINRPNYYDLPPLPSSPQIIHITMYMPHCRASAIEYIWRAGNKPGTSAIDDLRKAIRHLEYEIERLTESAAPTKVVATLQRFTKEELHP